MEIAKGGQVKSLQEDLKIKSITISKNDSGRFFDLSINDSSLSYLSIDELLDLKQEINDALSSLLL